ncbi:MAG: glycoside hydrolase family 30 beta sandwich domain-containing protein, partial [Ginsengibacter sp.]
WGGTTTPTAYHELSEAGKAKWWKYIKEYNILCQREYPVGGVLNYDLDNWDNLNYAKAHYYGDNFPNGEISDFAYNKKIQELGGFVTFEFWDFPKWIGDNEKEYARAMVGYCKEAKKKTGKAPRIVGVQNEVNMSEDDIKNFVPALRKALDEAGFSEVKIHMANAGNVAQALKRTPNYTQNPEVWKSIDYSASNEYDYQTYFTNPDGYDSTLMKWHEEIKRPFLAVEICTNEAKYQTNSYRLALAMGQLYQKNLALADAVLIGYCWNLINIEQPSFGQTRSLFVTSPEQGFIPVPSSDQLRVFGAYSRRIKEGMSRIETESSNKDLKVVAFKGAGGSATMVILNRSINPVDLKINWANVEFSELELTDPYSPNLIKPFKGKEVLIEPGAFVTITNVPLNN